jgi:hypothetical protein
MSADGRKVFVRAINDRLNLPGSFHGHWDPGVPAELGDVGRIRDDDWEQIGSAQNRGLGELGSPVEGDPAPLAFSSGKGIKIESELKGSTKTGFEFIGDAAAGIKITFGRSEAAVVVTPDLRYRQLPDERTLAKAMIQAWHEDKRLEYGDQVLVGLAEATTALILVTEKGNSGVDITTNATITTGSIDIADVKGDLSIANTREMSYRRDFSKGRAIIGHRALELVQKGVIFRHPSTRPALAPQYDLIMSNEEALGPVA